MTDPRIIFFVDHASAIGGAETNLLMLCKNLNRSFWQPHLACPGGLLAEKAQKLDIPVHIMPMPRLRRSIRFLSDWLFGARRLAKLAQQIDARIIYSNTIRATLYAAFAARLANLPMIWHMQDFWLSETKPRFPWVDRYLKRLLCQTATQVITNSHAVAAHLPASCNPVTILNAIDVDELDPEHDSTPFRKYLGIPPLAPVVGMIGRLRPWKGQERFLRAMSQIAKAHSEVHFLIVGGAIFDVKTNYEERLSQLSRELGIEDRVTFTGHLDDVRPALAAMDVFVHPGDPEPFGLVIIEAMAMAKPVVAYSHGALPEIVVDGKTGLLVPPRDEAALARAVQTLLSDPNQRKTMGTAGRKRAETHFSAHLMIRKTEALLADVVEKTRFPFE